MFKPLNIPHSQEAEEALIGAVLAYPQIYSPLSEIVRKNDFFLVRHQYIWETLEELNKSGIEADYVTVQAHLQQRRKLDEIGGAAYLVYCVNNTPTSAHAEAYARIVVNAAVRREMLNIADSIQGWVYSDTPTDLVLSQCEDAFYSVTNRATEKRSWRMVDISEMKVRPPVKWLIPGVIPANGLCMLFGPSGVYKSFHALDLAVQVSRKTNCIYVLAEGNDGMPSRINAYEKHHNVQLQNLFFCDGAIDMFSDVEMTAFRRIIGQYKPGLIIVDTFAMCTGGADENSARDMKVIVEQCRRITDQLKCAILLVHHTNKEGLAERGSATIRNNSETTIRMIKMDDVVQVESLKSRDRTQFATYYLKPVTVQLGYKDDDGNDVSSLVLLPADNVVATNDLTPLQLQILKALAVEPNASFADLATMTEQRRGVIQRVITKLTDAGYVDAWDGQQRSVTTAGHAVLNPTGSDEKRPIDGDIDQAKTPRKTTLFDIELTPVQPRNHYTEGL